MAPSPARQLSLLATGLALCLTAACSASGGEIPRAASASASTSASASGQPGPTESTAPEAEETPTAEAPATEASQEETEAPEATQEPGAEPTQAPDPQAPNTQGWAETQSTEAQEANPAAAENNQESAPLRDENTQALSEADEQPVLAQPAPAEEAPSAAVTEIDQESAVFWESCEAAAAEGITNILEGTPGYRVELDPDANGVACEG